LKRLAIVFACLLLLFSGCIIYQSPPANPATPVTTPPSVIVFSSNPAAINPGGTSTLLWNVTGATVVSMDRGIGQVEVAGTILVSPASSTVYTLTASNPAGTVTRSATVTVNIVTPTPTPTPVPVTPPPQTTTGNPVINFTANHLGGTSWQLNWTVTNATQVVIQPDIGPVNLTGSKTVTVPSGETRTYRLEATNNWGWAYWQVMMRSP